MLSPILTPGLDAVGSLAMAVVMDSINPDAAYWHRIDAYAEAKNAGFNSRSAADMPPLWSYHPTLCEAFDQGRAEMALLRRVSNCLCCRAGYCAEHF